MIGRRKLSPFLPRRALQQLRQNSDGAVMVEFALVLPFLLALLGTSIEFTRMWMVNRSFETTVDSVARMAARFPEYDSRVRAGAPILARELFRGGDWQSINLKVDSLRIEKQAYVPIFEGKNLLGHDTGKSWKDGGVPAGSMINLSTVIYVTASYDYNPIFKSFLGSNTISFRKNFVITPYFSRTYNYNAGASADVFVD